METLLLFNYFVKYYLKKKFILNNNVNCIIYTYIYVCIYVYILILRSSFFASYCLHS